VQPVVSVSVQTGWQFTVCLSVQVGISTYLWTRAGAPGGAGPVLTAQSLPGSPPKSAPQVGSGGAMQSTPGCPLVPGRPLHYGSGGVQLTSGIPLVPLPLQIGAFLLVQLVSGLSESAPMQVGRSPSLVVM